MDRKPRKIKKVVHLITLLEFGGAQGNTIYTVSHLNKERFDAYLWSGRGAYLDQYVQKTVPPDKIDYIPCLVRPINPIKDVFALAYLCWKLFCFKPDILHTHSSKAGILGRVAGWAVRFLGIRMTIVHTFHGFGFNDQQKPWVRKIFVWLEQWTARKSQGLIFVSKSNMDLARKEKIINSHTKAESILIRSGVLLDVLKPYDPEREKMELRQSFNIPEKSPIVLTIGAFKPQKNLSDFIYMAKDVASRVPNAVFVILGDGEQRPGLEKLARNLGMSDKVKMPGWSHNVPNWFSISKLFVLTSLWEGLPRALVESLAMGKPAVCYDTDGVHDLLSQGGGLLVPQHDRKALTEAVVRLLNSPAEWDKYAKQGPMIVGEEFNITKMVEQQEQFYRKLQPL